MLGSAARFILTGGIATLVHLAVAMQLMWFGMLPLKSNIVAFATAFIVSFWGHHLFTFAGHGSAARQTFGRFALVASTGFMANESVLFLLLRSDAVHPEISVIISTAFAAACTFILSRSWVFARDKALSQGYSSSTESTSHRSS